MINKHPAGNIDLVPALIESLVRGESLLFLGADYLLGETGVPTRAHIAAALAEAYELIPDPKLSRVASQFISQRPQSRAELVAFLKAQVDPSPPRQPTEVHHAIARLGFQTVVTACYDNLLEQAYKAVGKRVTPIAPGTDITYLPNESDVYVIKLYGDLKDAFSQAPPPGSSRSKERAGTTPSAMAGAGARRRDATQVEERSRARQRPGGSLILTHHDLIELETHLPQRLAPIRASIRLCPPIFIAWDPSDETLIRLYTAMADIMGPMAWERPFDHAQSDNLVIPNAREESSPSQYSRMRAPSGYIVWPDSRPEDVAWWAAHNISVLSVNPLTFLKNLEHYTIREGQAVSEGYASRMLGDFERPQKDLTSYEELESPDEKVGIIMDKLPYKALRHFEVEDHPLFFGRETEIDQVYNLTLAASHLVLFGPLGVGKSSLLCAGVIPRLQRAGYTCAYIPVLADPLSAIHTNVCRSRPEVCQALGLESHRQTRSVRSNYNLRDFLQAVMGGEGRLVLILDQFEEFLRYADRQTRAKFWRELRACLMLKVPEVHIVLSLREAYLPMLDEARRPLGPQELAPAPTILHHTYRLANFQHEAARRALIEPANHTRCRLESKLIAALLDSGERINQGVALIEHDGTVYPLALEVVLSRLYHQALADMGHRPIPRRARTRSDPLPPLTLTLDLYRTLGGANDILNTYVSDTLNEIPQWEGDREIAAAILKVLVKSRVNQVMLTEAEMVEMMTEADLGLDFDPGDQQVMLAFRATCMALIDLGLVRSFELEGQTGYALIHPYIAQEISTWLDETAFHIKLARDLLMHEMQSWHKSGELIEPTALRLIHAHHKPLLPLPSSEVELLFRSALDIGFEAEYWLERAHEAGVAVKDIVSAGMRSPDFRIRVSTVLLLADLEVLHNEPWFLGTMTEMLGDDYPQVRLAAIAMLEQLWPDGPWREHLVHECYIPEGAFIMGTDAELGRDNEHPAHKVTLDAFYIKKHLVTNADYKRYMEDIGQPFDIPVGMANHPVVGITWYNARDYAAWAGMQLPSEAEWEKAASWEAVEAMPQRSLTEAEGQKYVYPWGDVFDERKCNTAESGIEHTTPVGLYSPDGDSAYGCADMAGNVWEWTRSLNASYPYRADDGREAPTAPGYRILRGGAYLDLAEDARTTFRSWYFPNLYRDYHGFRTVIATPVVFLPEILSQ